MKVESIAECSYWSIQQYFWTTLSDNWVWEWPFYTGITGERSGSVVECLTRDRWAAGSSLTGVYAM